MKVLITGVCGFVGFSIAEYLLAACEGVSIVGVDNLMRPGAEANRTRLRRIGVTFRHGDIRLASDLEALPATDWVIDAAANPSVLAGIGNGSSSRSLIEHNLIGALHVLEYCKSHKAGLVLLSSSRVYSIPALLSLPLRVDGNAFEIAPGALLPAGASAEGLNAAFCTQPPISLYGSTKLAAETVALDYGAAFDFPVWINRCGVLAGAGQFGTPEQGIFSYWIHAHRSGCPLRYIGFDGTGRQTRDVLHPRDLGSLVAAQMSESRAGGQRVYTLGGGRKNAISLAALNDWCDSRFRPHKPMSDLRPRPYDVPWVVMDNSDAARDFGWKREVALQDLLEEIACHAEANPGWLERSNA